MNNIVLDKTDDKQLNDTNNLGPWDSLLSNDLYGFTEEWTNLKKDNDILELSETLKNASKETHLCMNLINASYEDDVNIIVPDTRKNDEEMAVIEAIEWLKKSQYKGIWTKEESHQIYKTLQRLPLSIIARTNMSVLLYNTFHPPSEEDVNKLEKIEETDLYNDDDDETMTMTMMTLIKIVYYIFIE